MSGGQWAKRRAREGRRDVHDAAAEFEYHQPTSLDEAISLLGSIEDSRPLAGGHSLLPMMKLRLAMPAALVDLGRIPGLDEISASNGGLKIGALATHAAVAGSEVAIGIAR